MSGMGLGGWSAAGALVLYALFFRVSFAESEAGLGDLKRESARHRGELLVAQAAVLSAIRDLRRLSVQGPGSNCMPQRTPTPVGFC